MGQKQSKGKGKKGSSKSSEPEASPAPSGNNAPAKSENNAPAAAPAKDSKTEKKGEIDWEAPVLFSDDNKPVCKDDFELLKVIGKGSFGKVCFLFFFFLICTFIYFIFFF